MAKYIDVVKKHAESLLGDIEHIPNGERNTTLHKLACKAFKLFDNENNVIKFIEDYCIPLCDDNEEYATAGGKSEIYNLIDSAERAHRKYKAMHDDYLSYDQYMNSLKKAVNINAPKYELDFEVDNKGIARKNSIRNLELVIDNYNFSIYKNEISKKITIKKNGVNINIQTEDFVTDIMDYAEKAELKISRPTCEAILSRIASRNPYNPVTEYLESVYEKYKDELDTENLPNLTALFDTFKLTKPENKDFLFTLFKMWMMSAARIAYNEGEFSMQGILTLQGPQGLGKTHFFYTLLPESLRQYGHEGVKLAKLDKDALMQATGIWLGEVGEMGQALKRGDRDELKRFITTTEDNFRAPFGKCDYTYPRRSAYLGTVNDTAFLTDETGNRRFWVIALQKFDKEALALINKDKVWAEVRASLITAKDEDFYLSQEQVNQLEAIIKNHRDRTSEEIVLLDSLDFGAEPDKYVKMTATEIYDKINLPGTTPKKIARAVRALMNDFPNIQEKSHSNRVVFYIPPFLTSWNKI